MATTIPVINIAHLCHPHPDYTSVELQHCAQAIHSACATVGFFYISGWESIVCRRNIVRLETLAKEFFQWPRHEKMKIAMKNSGLHWKGYFPSGDELTSGKPDAKEGIYFGEEYALESKQVQHHKLAMHGPNQFPGTGVLHEEWKQCVLLYLEELTHLGLCLMRGISLSLQLPPNYFEKTFCQPRPFTPFRIFQYPGNDVRQGVGRHTDYGCLTILKQDNVGGLEVEVQPGHWEAAPPIENTFVVNIGDMLEIWTSGVYKATPHRVVPGLSRARMSMPFFFDPAFEAVIDPEEMKLGSIMLKNAAGENEIVLASGHGGGSGNGGSNATQDNANKQGKIRYGDYISHKVSAVFPELFESSGGKDRLSKM